MLTIWMLSLAIETQDDPVVMAGPYTSEAACFMAGDLMKAADQAARGGEHKYAIFCTEQPDTPPKS